MSTAIEQIKEKLSIVDVISSYITLEKAGLNLKALCPFHTEKTPSFTVSPDRGTYYCFGCGAKGDIISFVQNFEGLDFIGALRILADRAGVELTRDSGRARGERSEKEKLYLIMEHATLFFQRELGGQSEAKAYLKKRGLKDETIKAWRLGYASAEWQALGDYLRTKGFSDRDSEMAGLVKLSEKTTAAVSGAGSQKYATPVDRLQMPPIPAAGPRTTARYYDRFRGRIMFPIFDASGRVVAFSGRQFVSDGTEAKYINSPETPLFEKSKILYGYDKARLDIRKRGFTLLVEGQMDLIMAHQAGFGNTVASSGTALTLQQLEIINRLSSNLVICYDGDHAGREAAKRGWRIAIGLGMEVKIAELPHGKDPADLALENGAEFVKLIGAARHIILSELAKIVSEFPDDRERAKAITRDILPYVAEVPSVTEKSRFVSTIALEARVPEKIIWDDLERVHQALHLNQPTAPHASQFSQRSTNRAALDGLDPDRPTSRRMSVERSLLGVMYWQEVQQGNKGPESGLSKNIKAKLESIMNIQALEKLEAELEARREQLIFQAELSFGKEKDLERTIEELVLDLKEEYIKEEINLAKGLLQVAESRKEHETSKELVRRLDELIIARNAVAEQKSSFSYHENQ